MRRQSGQTTTQAHGFRGVPATPMRLSISGEEAGYMVTTKARGEQPLAARGHTAPQMTGRLSTADADQMFRDYYESRDPLLRERLVGAHLGLAISLASRFSSRHESLDDLHQAAMLGLLHAIDRFDPT